MVKCSRSIGVNVSDPRMVSSQTGWELQDDAARKFIDTRWCWSPEPCLHMPSVCAEYEANNCLRNLISADDMHWCTETIGAHFAAGIACLLGCALTECKDETESDGSISSCEQVCNNQFMSLDPLSSKLVSSESWFSSC